MHTGSLIGTTDGRRDPGSSGPGMAPGVRGSGGPRGVGVMDGQYISPHYTLKNMVVLCTIHARIVYPYSPLVYIPYTYH